MSTYNGPYCPTYHHIHFDVYETTPEIVLFFNQLVIEGWKQAPFNLDISKYPKLRKLANHRPIHHITYKGRKFDTGKPQHEDEIYEIAKNALQRLILIKPDFKGYQEIEDIHSRQFTPEPLDLEKNKAEKIPLKFKRAKRVKKTYDVNNQEFYEIHITVPIKYALDNAKSFIKAGFKGIGKYDEETGEELVVITGLYDDFAISDDVFTEIRCLLVPYRTKLEEKKFFFNPSQTSFELTVIEPV